MKSAINPDIKNKIRESPVSNNVKELLYELIDFEYEHIDEPNMKYKEPYRNAINRWKKQDE